MKKSVLLIVKLLVILYILGCAFLYFKQESFIFFPRKTAINHPYTFKQSFDEVFLKMEDGTNLHGLFFPSLNAKGVILYLHGNAGILESTGNIADIYTDLNYDVFMLDYRGYGKSEGEIESEEQLLSDVQTAYEYLKKNYEEEQIVVLGYSIGSGLASYLAASNNPGKVILQAPYYCLNDLMRSAYPIVPTFLLKYKFNNHENLDKCKMPVVLIHGNQDRVINYSSSIKLKEHLKPTDSFITLKGQGHNGMHANVNYLNALANILQ